MYIELDVGKMEDGLWLLSSGDEVCIELRLSRLYSNRMIDCVEPHVELTFCRIESAGFLYLHDSTYDFRAVARRYKRKHS